MTSYASRRKRWYTRLREMDSEYSLPNKLLMDMMLECSGLTSDQQLMVMNSVGASAKFDQVAEEMAQQHPRIHETENRKPREDRRDTRYGRSGRPQGRNFGTRIWPRSTAYLAQEDPDDEEEYDYSEDEESS